MIRTLTGPALEPLSLDDVKQYLRVTHTSDDDHLQSLMISARMELEQYLERSLITQTFQVIYDLHQYRKGGTLSGNDHHPYQILLGRIALTLPYPPLLKVLQVQVHTATGECMDVGLDRVHVNSKREPGIVIVDSQWFPSVSITYQAGYGETREAVPAPLKLALKKLIAHHYEGGTEDVSALYASLQPLLSPYKQRSL